MLFISAYFFIFDGQNGNLGNSVNCMERAFSSPDRLIRAIFVGYIFERIKPDKISHLSLTGYNF